VYLLYAVIAALSVYAWRNWFVSLCGLIVLSAAMGHPDMPRTMFGIPGLNPWNVALALVALPWLTQRSQQGLRFDFPRPVKGLLVAYLLIVFVSYLRAVLDLDSFPSRLHHSGVERYTLLGVTFDYLINPVKYMIPGLMVFDGARTRQRVLIALCATLAMSVVYSWLVVRTIPLHSLEVNEKAQMRQRHRIGKRVGFHANSVAMACVAGCWGIVATCRLRRRWTHYALVCGLAALVAVAIMMTRSRAGYVAFAGVGLVLGVLLWRKLLILLPALAAVICVAFPGVPERLAMGFGVQEVSGEQTVDMNTVTASRMTVIWPAAIAEIVKSPLIGYGRVGILRNRAYDTMLEYTPTPPTHPHNAYLELLMDTGIVGTALVLSFFGALLWISARLCRQKHDPLLQAIGAASLAAVLAIMIMGLSGASFFPRENGQMAWCLFGLASRAAAATRPRRAPASVEFLRAAYGGRRAPA